jgi:hypothetical protein
VIKSSPENLEGFFWAYTPGSLQCRSSALAGTHLSEIPEQFKRHFKSYLIKFAKFDKNADQATGERI